MTEELTECRAARETLATELATAQATFSAKDKEISDLTIKYDTLFSTHERTLDELNEAKQSEESKDAVIAGLNLDVDELLSRGSDEVVRERLVALEFKLAESMGRMNGESNGELEVIFAIELFTIDHGDTFLPSQARVASLTEELKECRLARDILDIDLDVKREIILENHEKLAELKTAEFVLNRQESVIVELRVVVEALKSKLAESEQKRGELEVLSFSVDILYSPLTRCVFAGISEEG